MEKQEPIKKADLVIKDIKSRGAMKEFSHDVVKGVLDEILRDVLKDVLQEMLSNSFRRLKAWFKSVLFWRQPKKKRYQSALEQDYIITPDSSEESKKIENIKSVAPEENKSISPAEKKFLPRQASQQEFILPEPPYFQSQLRSPLGKNLQLIASLLQIVLVKGTNSMEKIHKKLAIVPFTIIRRIPSMEETSKDAIEMQERTLETVYDRMRDVNQKVCRLTNDLIDTIDSSHPLTSSEQDNSASKESILNSLDGQYISSSEKSGKDGNTD